MNRTTDGKKQQQRTTGKIQIKRKPVKSSANSDIRFVVTRNKRNSWLDEHYDSVPDTGDYPVFN